MYIASYEIFKTKNTECVVGKLMMTLDTIRKKLFVQGDIIFNQRQYDLRVPESYRLKNSTVAEVVVYKDYVAVFGRKEIVDELRKLRKEILEVEVIGNK